MLNLETWSEKTYFIYDGDIEVLACPHDTPHSVAKREIGVGDPEEGVYKAFDGTLWKRNIRIRRV